MRFIDEVNIFVQAGKGGNGIISFRREAHVDKGGPDGGDGGNGGSVFFKGDAGENTLLQFYYQNKIVAKDGENGKPKNAYGANAEDLIVKVPFGTMVYDKENKLIADVIDDQLYLIAKGGKGGRGNLKFKSSRNTAPRICENGLSGEKHELHLVLKVLADIGFVGKPSAGKSTILSLISNAKPKIADYDFTTLVPQLGMVQYYDKSFVVADLPGLIEKASEGKGLGIQFLKHIERCKVIAHIIDFGSENKNPIEDYEVINNELKSYNLKLEQLPQVVIANKSDLPSFEQHLSEFKKKFKKVKLIPYSALYNENIDVIKNALWNALDKVRQNVSLVEQNEDVVVVSMKKDPIKIHRLNENTWEITGEEVIEAYERIPLVSLDNLWRLNKKLSSLGVHDLIRSHNVKNGDTIRIKDYEFSWNEEDFQQEKY
ncbi:GTPase obg [Metamycoplasma cloacale]|uniref:GTPase Obg n=1 Tax=Metamycoplasma cloacale TaxID=92401 RepID=A0A2Z4LLZ5_9BACT|nr:GTPase ObgE [Metamycoplasma cloacale]AWX42765.1 GTPase ObgE [Metamycoplasma cloacale]VEU79420.1 GTPase obg [Metamycoplasma cloacale]